MGRESSSESNRSNFSLISIAGAFAVLLLLLHTASLIEDDVEGGSVTAMGEVSSVSSRRDQLFAQQLEKYAKKKTEMAVQAAAKKAKATTLYKSPSKEELDAALADYNRIAAQPTAFEGGLWDSNHNLSVTRQFEVRAAMNKLGQRFVSQLSVETAKDIVTCKRTVVSVATVPKRFPYLEGLIRSFKWQNWQPDAILIALPPFAPRMREKYVVPDFIAKDPSVTLVEMPVDYGPISKLAAALIHEKDPETCIFTVDDDNQPREYFFEKMVTWGAVFPGAVIAESGWNATCIYSRLPYICPTGYDTYLFVRQDYDFMCQDTSMPLYGFQHCISPVDNFTPRGVEVVMGVSNPLYRRHFFDDDFLDIATIVARQKVQKMIDEDEAARKGTGDQSKTVPDDVLELAKKSLAHPDMQVTESQKQYETLPPPSQIFTVDDVYISAYLARKGVPAIVVPATNDGRPPIPELRKPKKDWPPAPPAPAVDHSVGLDTINALHGEAHFNEANYIAVRYFDSLRWWNYKPIVGTENN